jgi:hypothetical protein
MFVDHLLVVSVVRVAATAVMLRTVWATTSDLLAGHRRTDVDLVADRPALLERLWAARAAAVPAGGRGASAGIGDGGRRPG